MKIQVGGLSEGIHHYRFQVQAPDLELGEAFAGEVTVEVDLEKTGSQLTLNAQLDLEGAFVCDRCVKHFTRRLRPSYRMYYVMDAEDADRFDPADVQILSPAAPAIELNEDVRQTILLSVPLKVVCEESCKGLCPQCGVNWNDTTCDCGGIEVDSRWEKLKSLRQN